MVYFLIIPPLAPGEHLGHPRQEHLAHHLCHGTAVPGAQRAGRRRHQGRGLENDGKIHGNP